MPTSTSAEIIDDPLWIPDGEKKLRDPNMYITDAGKYILSGTHKYVIEYDSEHELTAEKGTPYFVTLWSPNGMRKLRANGFYEWEKTFFNTPNGIRMVSSVPTVSDFNVDKRADAGKRSVYLFEPKSVSKKTPTGFPLDWKMASNTPFVPKSYNIDIFVDTDGQMYGYSDERRDKALSTTCIIGQKISPSLELGEKTIITCPGERVLTEKDSTGWDRNNPLPSEVRFGDKGGLLEGLWMHPGPDGKYYGMYSSGDYASEDKYGGYLLLCDSAMGPCTKIMDPDSGDAREFLPGSSKNFFKVGRPYPLLNAEGELIDVIFHAKKRGATIDHTLRCRNFAVTMLGDFVNGGAGCIYDDITPKTIVGTSTQPNIINIVLDDAAFEDFTSRNLIRPSIDSFGAESMLFDQFYTTPMSSPTRTSLLTGRYPAEYGLQWVYGPRSIRGIEPTEKTIVSQLNQAGYTTAHVGKWHAGFGAGYKPWDMPFDFAFSTPGLNGPISKKTYMNPVLSTDGITAVTYKDQHYTDVVTNEAISFIEKQRTVDAPFFLNLWHYAPRTPYTPSDRWLKQYEETDPLRTYKALFSQADENIGLLVDYIDAHAELRKNTIIMISSGNGGTSKTRDTNAGLRGYKTDVYEGGIKAPLFVRWPSTIAPGTQNSLVSSMDIVPTIIDLAGANTFSDMSGVSFASLLTGEDTEMKRTEPLFWMHKQNADIAAGNLKPKHVELSYAVRDGDWKLVYEPSDKRQKQLFNIADDFGETNDVAHKNISRVTEMYNKYLNWKTEKSEIPLTVDTINGDITHKNDVYTFAQTSSKSKNKVIIDKDEKRHFSNLDATFVANIEMKGRGQKIRRIAYQQESWLLRVTKENKLNLTLFNSKNERTHVTSNMTLKNGVSYDVAFSVSGTQKAGSFVEVFVRPENEKEFSIVASGIIDDAIQYTDYPIVYGASPSGYEPFVGSIKNPRLFIAPFTKDELTTVYEPQDPSVKARVIFDAVGSASGVSHGEKVQLADGTVVGSGEWFPLTKKGKFIDDDIFPHRIKNAETFDGLMLSRLGDGEVRIAHVGNSKSHKDYEYADIRIEVSGGTFAKKLVPLKFEKDKDPSRYADIGTSVEKYDYAKRDSSRVLSMGTFVHVGYDALKFRVRPVGDVRGASISLSSILSDIKYQLQRIHEVWN